MGREDELEIDLTFKDINNETAFVAAIADALYRDWLAEVALDDVNTYDYDRADGKEGSHKDAKPSNVHAVAGSQITQRLEAA